MLAEAPLTLAVVIVATERPWWADLLLQAASGIIAGILSGAIVLVVGYLAIDNRLHLKERRDQSEREQKGRQVIRRAVLSHVLGELRSNASLLRKWRKYLTDADPGVPYPGFDVTGWNLVSQMPALAAIDEKTISALACAYNRFVSANGQRDQLADLTHGATSILVNNLAAPSIDENPKVAEAYRGFQKTRETLRQMLIDRLTDLRPFIKSAIRAVEAELKTQGSPPA